MFTSEELLELSDTEIIMYILSNTGYNDIINIVNKCLLDN